MALSPERERVPVLTGTSASLSNVRSRVEGAELLYFATHGAANPSDPLRRGGLYFAGDSLWSVAEVQRAPLEAAYLVVLSAC